MSTSVNKSSPETASPLFVRMWSRLWFRMCCLVGVLVFELGLTWFILHFGWLESVNIWTQLGVVFVAALPLLLAGVFLVRKRFSMKSALFAFTMFAVFMGWTMRPVYEARQAREPAKLLSESGARVIDDYRATLNLDSEAPRIEHRYFDRERMSVWMSRLLGDYANHPSATSIYAVSVESDQQAAVLSDMVSRLKNIQGLNLGAQLTGDYASYKDLIRDSGVGFLGFGTHNLQSDLRTNLNWIAGCSEVHSLNLMNISNDIDMILESDELDVAGLHLWRPILRQQIAWDEFTDAKLVRNLKMLSIQGYEISDSEAKHFSNLDNLRNLSIGGNSLDGITFLHHLPKLKIARADVPMLTAKQLEDFVIPENLEELHLTVSSVLISESEVDKFKASAPKGCVVHVKIL